MCGSKGHLTTKHPQNNEKRKQEEQKDKKLHKKH
jgi:hypothetical protein